MSKIASQQHSGLHGGRETVATHASDRKLTVKFF